MDFVRPSPVSFVEIEITAATSFEQKMQTIYSPLARRDPGNLERKKAISALGLEEQMLLLKHKKLRELKDADKLGPVHDLARFGKPQVQLAILANKKVFDTETFRARLGTPIDMLASNGSIEAQKEILKLPREELVAIRGNGATLVHVLARRITADDQLGILELPLDLLRVKTQSGEAVIRTAYDSANGQLRRQLYEKFPLWNRM